VWVDWEDIRPTEDFMRAIHSAIEGVDTFVFVLTPDSVASVVCGREIAHAVAHNKRMVPVVVRDVNADTVHEALAKLNWIFCRESDDFEKAADTLISAFDTDLDWVHAHTACSRVQSSGRTKGRTTALSCAVMICGRLSDGWRKLAPKKERQPTALQTEYIIASRKASARRQRITLGAVTFGFVVAVVLAIVALFARHKAVEQETKAKNTSVQADCDLALLYRQKSEAVDPRVLAHLARALRTSGDARLPRQYLVSLLRDGGWHVPETEPMRHEGKVLAASFSPDGRADRHRI
jgi:hypothetical protein